MALSHNYNRNKWLLLGALAYSIYGLIGNFFNDYLKRLSYMDTLFAIQMVHATVVCTIVLIIVVAIFGRKTKADSWGFTLDNGCWISLFLCILVTLPYYSVLKFSWLGNWFWDPVQIVSISVEELTCRVMLITGLAYTLRRLHRGRILAVVISAFIFVIPHIPTHSTSELVNFIFPLGLVFGFAYILTGSILFPIYGHVMTNLGEYLGYTAGLSVIASYFIIALLGRFRMNRANSNSQFAKDQDILPSDKSSG